MSTPSSIAELLQLRENQRLVHAQRVQRFNSDVLSSRQRWRRPVQARITPADQRAIERVLRTVKKFECNEAFILGLAQRIAFRRPVKVKQNLPDASVISLAAEATRAYLSNPIVVQLLVQSPVLWQLPELLDQYKKILDAVALADAAFNGRSGAAIAACWLSAYLFQRTGKVQFQMIADIVTYGYGIDLSKEAVRQLVYNGKKHPFGSILRLAYPDQATKD